MTKGLMSAATIASQFITDLAWQLRIISCSASDAVRVCAPKANRSIDGVNVQLLPGLAATIEATVAREN